uniref:Uncharacterized protein n=1 Tax=Rhizophora mucronata TaxID=61149 RepID=A0A2P2P5K7_RHIMU
MCQGIIVKRLEITSISDLCFVIFS